MEQNIISIGFNVAEFTSQQKTVYDLSLKTLDVLREMDGFKISPGSYAGWGELKNQVAGLEQKMRELTETNIKLSQAITNGNAVQKQAATNTIQSTKAVEQETTSLKENIQTRLALNNQLKANAQYQKELGVQLRAGFITQKEYNAAIINAGVTTEYTKNKIADLDKTIKSQTQTQKSAAVEQQKISAQQAKDARILQEANDKTAKSTQALIDKQKKATNDLGNDYKQLALAAKDATEKAQIAQLRDPGSANTAQLILNARQLNERLKEVDAQVGLNQRNVGNYSNAFVGGMNKAWSAIRRIAQILPGIGIAGIFGLALNPLFTWIQGLFTATQSLKELNTEYQNLNNLIKENIDFVAKSNYAAVAGLQKLLDLAEKSGQSHLDILALRKKVAAEELNIANQQLIEAGRGDRVNDKAVTDRETALEYLAAAEKNYLIEYKANKSALDQLQLEFINASNSGTNNRVDALKEKIESQTAIVKTAKDAYENIVDVQKNAIEKQKNIELLDIEEKKYRAEQKLSIEVETAKRKAQSIIDANDRILNDERYFEASRMQALKNAAYERKAIIDAELRKIKENPANTNADGTHTAEYINAEEAANAEKIKIDKDLQVALFNNSEEFRKRRLSAELEIQKAEIGLVSDKNKLISESDTKGFDDRIIAYGNYYLAERDLIQKDADFQLATTVKTAEEKLALTAATNKKLIDLAIKSKKELADIFVSNENSLLSLSESQDKLKLSKDELNLYRALKNKKDFAKKGHELEIEQQRLSIQNDIFTQRAIIESGVTTEQQKKAAAQRILDNQTKLNTLELSAEQEKNAKKLSLSEFIYQLEQKGVETFFSLYQKLSDAKHQKVLAQLAEEGRALDENHSKEINNINSSTISAQEKAAQITVLEAQHAAQKQELAEKERQEKIKQAKTDKDIAIAKIIVEGALAVVHAYTTGGAYAAVLAAAGVAAELALAIATEIPAYAEGGIHPGGPAIYGEGKTAELVEEPGKAPYVVDKATLGIMPKGTKFTPLTNDYINEQMYSSMISSQAERFMLAEMVNNNKQDSAILKDIKNAIIESGIRSESAIKKQKGNVSVFFDSGFNNYIQKTVRD